jgi:hypothetical protein
VESAKAGLHFVLLVRPTTVPAELLELPPTTFVTWSDRRADWSSSGQLQAENLRLNITRTIERQREGFFHLPEVAQILADDNNLCAATLMRDITEALRRGSLIPRSMETKIRTHKQRTAHIPYSVSEVLSIADIDEWLAAEGVSYRFPKVEYPPKQAEALPRVDVALWSEKGELLEAFGPWLKDKWFYRLDERKWLRAAKRQDGKPGRNGAKPLFCPFAVMIGLLGSAHLGGQTGPTLTEPIAWGRLQRHFPRTHAKYEERRRRTGPA